MNLIVFFNCVEIVAGYGCNHAYENGTELFGAQRLE